MNAIEANFNAHYKDVRSRLMSPPKTVNIIVEAHREAVRLAQLAAREALQKKLLEERRRKARERAAKRRAKLGPITPAARRSMDGIAREVSIKYDLTLKEMRTEYRGRNHVCCRTEFVWAVGFYLPHLRVRDIANFLDKDTTTIRHMQGRLKKKQPDYILQLKKYLGTIYVTKTEHGGVYRGIKPCSD